MDIVSLNHPAWDADMPDPPFAARVMRVGAHAGAQRLGASLYELDPGGSVSPYHIHHGNEELLVVLGGTPHLRTSTGTRALVTGEVVSFLEGPAGAHRVFNPTADPARVLIVSTMSFPEIAEHGDTGTLLAMTGPAEGKAFASGSDEPFMELVVRALQAAPEHDAAT